VSALAAALLTRQVVFVVVGAITGGLLGFSIAGLRQPLPRALMALEGWPFYFRAAGAGAMHLKVAQPRQVSVEPGQVLIGTARYVQWESRKIPQGRRCLSADRGSVA